MVIRKSFLFALATAGFSLAGMVHSALGQNAISSPMLESSSPGGSSFVGPAGGMTISDGGLSSLGEIELAPGETIIEGPPELRGMTLPTTTMQSPHSAAPGHISGGCGPGCSPGCYVPCEPGYYTVAEALFLQRSGGSGFTRALGYAFDDYEFELAPRIVWGRRFDCVDGYEFAYTGMLEWEDTIYGGVGQSLIAARPPLNPLAFSVFDNAVGQFQRREASFNSFEFNRTYTGWDVVRLMMGIRGILYDEEYYYGATDGVNSALLVQRVDNVLVGPQIGLQLFYPLGLRLYTDTTMKAGAYLNFADSDGALYQFVQNGPVVSGSTDELGISGMFEIGTKLGINLTDCLSATIGYEVWYMAGIAEASGQVPFSYGPRTPFSLNADEDVFIHGLTCGIQFVY